MKADPCTETESEVWNFGRRCLDICQCPPNLKYPRKNKVGSSRNWRVLNFPRDNRGLSFLQLQYEPLMKGEDEEMKGERKKGERKKRREGKEKWGSGIDENAPK